MRLRTTINAAAFAPEALRRASPELGKKTPERRREAAEGAENKKALRGLRSLRSYANKSLWLFGLLVAAAPPAFAQSAWEGRARVTISAGAQVETQRLSETISLTKYIEPAPLTAELPKAAVPVFDIGVAVRLVGNLGAGVSVSSLTNRDEAEVTADIPHPFYFGQPRPISGTVSGVKHKELAAHTDIVYLIGSPRIDLMLSAGASFFRVEQSFVSDVTYAELYPYDTAAFVNATLVTERQSKVGYNAGADVTWKLSPQWGLGGMIRFARARVPFTIGEIDTGTVDAGGLQAGAGLRLMF